MQITVTRQCAALDLAEAVVSSHQASPRGLKNALRSAAALYPEMVRAYGNRSGVQVYVVYGERRLRAHEIGRAIQFDFEGSTYSASELEMADLA